MKTNKDEDIIAEINVTPLVDIMLVLLIIFMLVSSIVDTYGIKDSLTILGATPSSITFVPLWVDDSHAVKSRHANAELAPKTPFILNRPVKPGTFAPIAEISSKNISMNEKESTENTYSS